MNKNVQKSLEILFRMRERLLESLMEELLKHEEYDFDSFAFQEIEDKFGIRIANLNTLIATFQEQYLINSLNPTVVTTVEEINKNKLEAKLNEILSFISPDNFINLSIVPTSSNKILFVLVYLNDNE